MPAMPQAPSQHSGEKSTETRSILTRTGIVASELLEAFRAGESVDLVRESVRLVM